MIDSHSIRAWGADDYLSLEGAPAAYSTALFVLFEGRQSVVTEAVCRNPDGISPIREIVVLPTDGPVKIRVDSGRASIMGGAQELIELKEFMRSQLGAGRGNHWEILRVFDDLYWWIDRKTHIDMVVV